MDQFFIILAFVNVIIWLSVGLKFVSYLRERPIFHNGSLKSTIGYALENELDHLTIGPNVISKGFFFSSLLAWFEFSVAFIFMTSKSAGVGAFNLIKKSTYQAIGSYKAIAMQPVDDFSLGKLVIKNGYKQSYGFSKGLISVKLYKNINATIKGLEKSQFPGMNYNVTATLVGCLFNLYVQIYPFIGLFFGSELARVLCGFSILIIAAIYNFSKKYFDISLKYALIHPVSVSLHLYAILRSMVKILNRGGLEWRGSFYSLKDLKKQTL